MEKTLFCGRCCEHFVPLIVRGMPVCPRCVADGDELHNIKKFVCMRRHWRR